MSAVRAVVLTFITVVAAACGGGGPDAQSLRDSFTQQLSTNKFITDFQRNGNEMAFSGPRSEGGTAKWTVRIDSAVVEETGKQAQPYKGTVKSTWMMDGQAVTPKGSQSNLPLELMANGLSQDCWAFWEQAQNRWSWE